MIGRAKLQKTQLKRKGLITLVLLLCCLNGQSFAGTLLDKCYRQPSLVPPPFSPTRTLYVFIDQTTNLNQNMKDSITNLVTQWGSQGENVKITRFSANIKGQYSELVFDEVGNNQPSEAYLFHIRPGPKRRLLKCLRERDKLFDQKLKKALDKTLKLTNDKLPKTNLLHALKDFARQIVKDDKTKDKTVLLVSDGLENSNLLSFHQRGRIRIINSRRALQQARRNKLIPKWNQATVYMLGLGHISDKNFYASPRVINPLKTFWKNYFKEGDAIVHPYSLGTPMILRKSLL